MATARSMNVFLRRLFLAFVELCHVLGRGHELERFLKRDGGLLGHVSVFGLFKVRP